jgi:site-specific DNA-methyltransferase (adenine-specific)
MPRRTELDPDEPIVGQRPLPAMPDPAGVPVSLPAPHYVDESVTLYAGDCLDVLAALPDGSVDAVVTDPPYGISFMGKEWDQPGEYGSTRRGGSTRSFAAGSVGQDHRTTTERSASMHAGKYDLSTSAMQSFQRWCEAWAAECLRVLKPGGHMLAFGGTRTWHRLACAVEDAGFEVRDSIAWLYGSGFPKSLDVSKAIDKAAGVERGIVGFRDPSGSGVAGRAVRDSTGSHIWSGELRSDQPATPAAQQWQGWGTALKPAFEPIVVARKPLAGTVAANVLQHGTGALNVDGCRVGSDSTQRTNTAEMGYHGGNLASVYSTGSAAGRWPTNVVLDGDAADELDRQAPNTGGAGAASGPTRTGRIAATAAYGARPGTDAPAVFYGDTGGASRFFPTFRYEPKAPTIERPRDGDAAHPTVKPLDLMRWLVRLVTPPGGTVLDPFAGSGTTGEACVIEGAQAILIEREAAYLPLIRARLGKPIQPDLFGGLG